MPFRHALIKSRAYAPQLHAGANRCRPFRCSVCVICVICGLSFRLAGLNSITPVPDFGATLKLADYEADINTFTTKLDSYNEKLSSIDSLQNEVDSLELKLREKNVRILSAAQSHYGPDSGEYEQVGGTRRSERKRTVPKGPRTTATSDAKPS